MSTPCEEDLFGHGPMFPTVRHRKEWMMSCKLSAIVAVCDDWGIGLGGGMVVENREDMRHFVACTTGHPVIMGRKTLESFPGGRPLKNRRNVVLKRMLTAGTITQEDLDHFKELYGLSDNSFKGIVEGYFGWLGNLAKGDLGISFKYDGKPVAQVISENMWISFAIALVATVLQFLIAIPLGIVSATKQYSAADYIVTVFTMIGISLPTYFFGAIVIKIFAADLGWLPFGGLLDASASYPETFAGFLQKSGDVIVHMIMPIFVSVILSLGGLMRYTRTNMLEVLGADYIRTARAKGLSEKTVIYKHAFRNTLIPLATMLAGILPSLFGGMMITEQVFGLDGIGRLAYNALRDGDIPFIMGYNMFLAVLTVIGTLLSDIMYSIVDPRVKLTK